MSKTGHSAETSRAGLSRRGFLEAGGLGAIGLAVGRLEAAASMPPNDRSLILLMLVGGPSQLETFDPKPDAPREIRGPFGSIATRLPGVRVNEFLPEVARRMDRLTLVRSLHHDASPIHETGCQLIQTGGLCRLGEEHPHVGSVVARARGARNVMPPFVVLPAPIGRTGVGLSHGQTAGALGPEFEPFHVGLADPPSGMRRALDLADEPIRLRDAYGRTPFGASCLRARRLVEAGVRVVTVNMFESVFNRVTWDAHGARPFSSLEDYERELLPAFDRAFSALVDDLESKGLIESTLVVATGEFGRTPKLNHAGGRDHWPGVWSAVLAGGGTRGGQVIGASDARAAEPIDRPVTPPELLATIYRGLGVDVRNVVALADVAPIAGVLA